MKKIVMAADALSEQVSTDWGTGEIVSIQRKDKMLKKNRANTYKKFISSKYVCIREASKGKQGILVKVLGKTPASFINIIGGKPFVKDDVEELFYNKNYYSFPFPKAAEVEEVLSIIRNNQELLKQFESISMHINTEASFWVRETAHNCLLMKKPQYLDAHSGKISKAKENDTYYRLSIVYFNNSGLIW